MKNINSKEELVEISATGKTYVQFSASWCGPCRLLTSTVEKLEQELTDVKFVKIDVEKNRDLAQEYSVRGVPKIVIIENGKVIAEAIGAKSEQQLKDLIS